MNRRLIHLLVLTCLLPALSLPAAGRRRHRDRRHCEPCPSDRYPYGCARYRPLYSHLPHPVPPAPRAYLPRVNTASLPHLDASVTGLLVLGGIVAAAGGVIALAAVNEHRKQAVVEKKTEAERVHEENEAYLSTPRRQPTEAELKAEYEAYQRQRRERGELAYR